MSEVTLLAMAPAGDVLVVRDRNGDVWVHPPSGVGRPRKIDPHMADRAIARHDFERVDRGFTTWEELDAFVEERVSRLPALPPVDPDALDAPNVRELLAVAERWATEGDVSGARRLAVRLLVVPAAAQESDLRESLLVFLEALDRQRPSVRSQPKSDFHRLARERYRQADNWEDLAA